MEGVGGVGGRAGEAGRVLGEPLPGGGGAGLLGFVRRAGTGMGLEGS